MHYFKSTFIIYDPNEISTIQHRIIYNAVVSNALVSRRMDTHNKFKNETFLKV